MINFTIAVIVQDLCVQVIRKLESQTVLMMLPNKEIRVKF